MTQVSLDFGRAERVSRTYRAVLRALDDAVTAMGGESVAAGACDREGAPCTRLDLHKALSGEDGRYFRVEWLLAIVDSAPESQRARIVEALLAWQGLAVAPQKPLTAEEKLARYERALIERFGAAGADLVRDVNK